MKKEIISGEPIDLLVKVIEEKDTKAGKKYCIFTLSNGKNDIQAKKWDTSFNEVSDLKGTVCNFTIQVGEYNNAPDYKIDSFKKSDAPIEEFIESPPVSPAVLFEEIVGVVEGFKNKDIKMITKTILTDNKEKLITWGAAKAVHHNIHGGLIWHMYRMLKMAIQTSDLYQGINKDILFSGVILHDIGKLTELETNMTGTSEYTVDGSLFGHLLIGSEMITDYASLLGTNKEVVRVLKHIISSHHGTQEMGAIVKPCMLEAVMVHHFDMIDSRAYQFEKALEGLEPGTSSERIFGLGNVNVYRSFLPLEGI